MCDLQRFKKSPDNQIDMYMLEYLITTNVPASVNSGFPINTINDSNK
jgi:hypothetical protein